MIIKTPKGKHEARVDSSLKKGKIPYGEISIKGQSKKEIFQHIYVTHRWQIMNFLDPLYQLEFQNTF